MVGYSFEIADTVVLTDLGTLDYGWDGMADGAMVAVWDAETGAMLSRATVPANATAPSSIWGGWRFVGIEPLTLTPGTYVIGSQVFNGSSDRYIHNAEVTAAAGVSWTAGLHASGTGLQYPTNVTTAEASWFGPNFLFLSGE